MPGVGGPEGCAGCAVSALQVAGAGYTHNCAGADGAVCAEGSGGRNLRLLGGAGWAGLSLPAGAGAGSLLLGSSRGQNRQRRRGPDPAAGAIFGAVRASHQFSCASLGLPLNRVELGAWRPTRHTSNNVRSRRRVPFASTIFWLVPRPRRRAPSLSWGWASSGGWERLGSRADWKHGCAPGARELNRWLATAVV